MDREEQIRKAVALRYEDGSDTVPRVVASGRGQVAENIIATARDAGVPLYQDATLAAMLARLDIGAGIPVELYQMVAQVLVFIYSLDKNASQRY